MRVLILNQAFHPDVVATAQHASDLAVALTQAGHEVYVVAGIRGYDDPSKEFSTQEVWSGVQIFRVRSAGLGKSSKFRRAIDFGSFLAACCFRMREVPTCDVIIALTSPPLISYLAAWLKRVTGAKLVYWTMDLNPDEAIAAGWLQENSIAARVLTAAHRFSVHRSDQIVVLDRFMKERISAIAVAESRVDVIPPWSHDEVAFNQCERDKFRQAHELNDKFVVMYSGNHSPCHPLDTVLNAAKVLATDRRVQFLFVGGGSQVPVVREFAIRERLRNVKCLPYQPKDKLSGSLSAADLHLVVMGDKFVGIVHPCKIYNILSIGCPFVYIGPNPSHVTDLVEQSAGKAKCLGLLKHGEVSGLVASVLGALDSQSVRTGSVSGNQYSSSHLIPLFVSKIESLLAKPAAIHAVANTSY